jgi:uroporphyrinogen III methyltransferase/synthase
MSLANLPLAHKTVMIACSEMKTIDLTSGLESLGAKVIVFPVIQIKELGDKSALDAALDRLAAYAWVIFTSGYGVRFFLDRMGARDLSISLLNRLQICAVGPATAAALEASGIRVTLVPREHTAEGILSALAEVHGGLHSLKGLRVLLPRALEARDLIPRRLEEAGALLDDVPCYENTLPRLNPDRRQSLLDHPPDLLVFTSSSTVSNFVTLLGSDDAYKLLSCTRVAVLGPITADTLAYHGRRADITPAESTIPSLLSAISLHYQNAKKEEKLAGRSQNGLCAEHGPASEF